MLNGLADLHVSPESVYVGKTLAELGIREKFGVSILKAERAAIDVACVKSELESIIVVSLGITVMFKSCSNFLTLLEV